MPYIDGFNVGGTFYAILPSGLSSQSTIDGVAYDGTSNIAHYAVCGTAASVTAKAASVTGFHLTAGAVVQVKFTNGNTKTNPTLNISGTGAKAMMLGNGTPVSTIAAGQAVFFVYDGTNYVASAPLYMPISTLPALANVSETTLIPADQSGVPSKITGRQIKEWAVEAVSTATVIVQPVDDVPTAGSTYPVSSGGVFKTKVPVNGMGKNLIDNWYFVGGGDQAGYGRFPINQREQTIYTGAGEYTIDRWRIAAANANTNVNVTSSGLTVSSTSTNVGRVMQPISPSYNGIITGNTVTISALVTNVTGNCGFSITMGTPGTSETTITGGALNNITAPGFYSITAHNVPALSSGRYYLCNIVSNPFSANANSSITVAAIKVEPGDCQTLAHNEGTDANPNWVLNELPNYADEMARCQAYFWNVRHYFQSTSTTTQYEAEANQASVSDEPYANITVVAPVIMRAHPSISCTFYALRGRDYNGNPVNWNSNITIDATAIRIGNTLHFHVTHDTATLPAYTTGLLAVFLELKFSADF